jgi:hypothetical protein
MISEKSGQNLEYKAQRIMDIKKDRGRYLPLSFDNYARSNTSIVIPSISSAGTSGGAQGEGLSSLTTPFTL